MTEHLAWWGSVLAAAFVGAALWTGAALVTVWWWCRLVGGGRDGE